MKQENFNKVSAAIFLIVGIIHLTRVIQGWNVSIDRWSIPMVASYVAVIVAAYLAYHGWQLASK